MIYRQQLLTIKILFENTTKKPIFGIQRPTVYMNETGTFFSMIRLDIFKKEIEPGASLILIGSLESPAGFGNHLKVGALLIITNGMDEIGKAVILEILPDYQA